MLATWFRLFTFSILLPTLGLLGCGSASPEPTEAEPSAAQDSEGGETAGLAAPGHGEGQGHGEHGRTMEERIESMAEMLQLDAAQTERLRETMAGLHAEAGSGQRHPHAGMPGFRAALEEILTPEQLQRFDAHIAEVHQQRWDAHGQQIAEALELDAEQVQALTAILEDNRPDVEAIRALPPEEARAKMHEHMALVGEKIEAILRPEQLERFRQQMSEHPSGGRRAH